MVFRHAIAFVGLAFFTVVADAEFEDFSGFIPLLVSAVFVYTWFMISSKMTANWWIPLVLLLVILYSINAYRNHAKKLPKDVAAYLDNGELAAVILSALITFFGFIIYVGEKKIEIAESSISPHLCWERRRARILRRRRLTGTR